MKQNNYTAPFSPASHLAIREVIAAKAHELWLCAGKPENQSDAFWLAAEHELLPGRGNPVLAPASF